MNDAQPKVNCVEICCGSTYSALQAAQGGATRIEFCGHLSVGGVSPSPISVAHIKKQTALNVQVLVRLRAGHFYFTEQELSEMVEEIEQYKSLQVKGIVTGALNENGEIDLKASKRLAEAAYPLPITFHRAFDDTPDARVALEQLIDLGYTRILTSGQKESVMDGASLVRNLVDWAQDRITILAGSGINLDNIRQVIDSTGAPEIHLTARSPYNHEVSRGLFYDPSHPTMETDASIVSQVMRYQK